MNSMMTRRHECTLEEGVRDLRRAAAVVRGSISTPLDLKPG
jgi:hypothetical protein